MMAGRWCVGVEVSMSALKKLVDKLAELNAVKLNVTAYGSGDEGTVDEPTVIDADGHEIEVCEDVTDLIDEAFEEKGFDYYNGNGGELQLEVIVPERSCSWSAYYNDLVMCNSSSSEEEV
jgi:hypothetical protein